MGRRALERKSCVKVGLGEFRGPLEGRQSNCKDTRRLNRAMSFRTEREQSRLPDRSKDKSSGARDRGSDPNSLCSYSTLGPREALLHGMVPHDLWQHSI